MATSSWKSLFPEATLTPLTVPMSDHVALLLKCQGTMNALAIRRFHFENKWCLEPDVPHVVRDCWTNLYGINIMERLMAVSDSISIWARHFNSSKILTKSKLQNVISLFKDGSIGILFVSSRQSGENLRVCCFVKKLTGSSAPNNIGLKRGDSNMKFFHVMALARCKKNTIVKLQRENGSWTSGEEDIKDVARDYFENLFAPPGPY
ncbi:uncharacterized protein LOC131007918 [Salvia miltiorrhiza]|uniref:uncharacterized protein LOC131007918 n=1 Tax=Salvia miltiorrhiza TaxID=226208 RepID=UPI0025AD0D33|nr:uncharacterized protein LOC131007918 [Salvia miltiorrhiza]